MANDDYRDADDDADDDNVNKNINNITRDVPVQSSDTKQALTQTFL